MHKSRVSVLGPSPALLTNHPSITTGFSVSIYLRILRGNFNIVTTTSSAELENCSYRVVVLRKTEENLAVSILRVLFHWPVKRRAEWKSFVYATGDTLRGMI